MKQRERETRAWGQKNSKWIVEKMFGAAVVLLFASLGNCFAFLIPVKNDIYSDACVHWGMNSPLETSLPSLMSPAPTVISLPVQSADAFSTMRGSGHSSLYDRRRLICWKTRQMGQLKVRWQQ